MFSRRYYDSGQLQLFQLKGADRVLENFRCGLMVSLDCSCKNENFCLFAGLRYDLN